MVKLDEQWAEVLTVLFIVIGFILALLLRNAPLSYLSIILAGFLAGRIFYIKRYKEPILPFVLIIVGFLLGYLLGGLWVSKTWVLIFFIVAFAVSYQLHVKKFFVIFKSEKFVR